jgi:GMP synthase-like glutamine amidotransferase
MRWLVINNDSKYTKDIEHMLGQRHAATVDVADFTFPVASGYDGVVLSGGSRVEVMDDPAYYAEEIKLIRQAEIPVIGICLGLQLMSYAFGRVVERLPEMRKGLTAVPGGKLSPVHLRVHEEHYWRVAEAPHQFKALARSVDGVEMMIAPKLRRAAFQFHPEVQKEATDGAAVFEWAFARLTLT